MSLSWRDRLIVGLAPEALTVVRLGKGLLPRPIRYREMRLEGNATTPWRPAVAALIALSSDVQWRTPDVEIVLSSHFVRYAVIPADPKIRSEEERAALGKIIFRKTYGTLCQDWPITISDAQSDSPMLGAAIPPELLSELHAALNGRFKIRAIRPNLVDAFNRVSAGLQSAPAILALLEQGRATIAQVSNGEWRSIVSRATQSDDPNAFVVLLAEETAIRPIAANTAVWVRDLTGSAIMPPSLSGRVRVVPDPWPDHPATSFMA